MNIDILEINKNTLKFMEILCKSVKMKLINNQIYILILHCNGILKPK